MTNLSNSSTAPASSHLTEEKQVRLYRLTLERDLGGYVRAAWPILEPATPFSENWHIDLIAEYLTLVRRREIKRLIINVPPRTGKSNLITALRKRTVPRLPDGSHEPTRIAQRPKGGLSQRMDFASTRIQATTYSSPAPYGRIGVRE